MACLLLVKSRCILYQRPVQKQKARHIVAPAPVAMG